MKITKFAVVAAFGCAALMASCNGDMKSAAKGEKIATAQDTFNYGLGYEYGKGLLEQMNHMPISDKDSLLNKEAIIKGFIDALYGDSTMNEDSLRKAQDAFFKKLMDKEQAKNAAAYTSIAKKYTDNGFKDLGKPADPRLQDYAGPNVLFKTLKEGTGEQVKMSDIVYIDYEGKLTNDTIFDSTTGKEPAMLMPGQVIPGFAQALCQMKEGEQATFLIPSELGYGAREAGPIPANSPLIFTVTIKNIFHNEKDAKAFMEKLHPEMAKPQAAPAK